MSAKDAFHRNYPRGTPHGDSHAIFSVYKSGYQSATERALRISLDVHAWASARNLDWRTVMTEYERRLKGDSPASLPLRESPDHEPSYDELDAILGRD